MRNFIKLSPKFWIGPTGREIRESGVETQIAALYLMSSPHINYIGLYHLPLVYLTGDTGLSQDAAKAALLELERVGFARYDKSSECAWVVEGAKWQIGETITAGDKNVLKIKREYDDLPSDCPFKSEFLTKYGQAYHMSAERAVKVAQPRKGMSHPDAVKSASDAKRAADAAKVAAANAAATSVEGQREKAHLMELLDSLMFARKQQGIGSATGDKLVAAAVWDVAAQHGNRIAASVLHSAIVFEDWGLEDMKSHIESAYSDDI